MLLRGKKKLTDFLLFCISGLLSVGCVISPVYSLNVDERQNSKSELQKRKKELNRELQQAASEVHKEAKNQDALDKEIKVVQTQIDVSNGYINNLNKEISSMERQITEIREKMKQRVITLKKSLYSIYVAGDTSTLDIVLGAKDFDDFLDKVDITRSVSRTIEGLIDGLKDDMERIKQKEQEILEEKKDREQEKSSQEKSKKELESLLDQSEKLLSELEDSENRVKRRIDQNDSEIKAIDAQIQKYYEEQRRKMAQAQQAPVVVNKSGFVWPVPGYTKITSGFNDSESRSHVHGAIDIAGHGVYGARIVAAASGKIILANCNGWGGGYGNYVVIDHGNGISTLYGHMSNVTVQKGQCVSAGEQIGNVGSTGFSTGPHLHFEYRVNGVRRNPHEILSF